VSHINEFLKIALFFVVFFVLFFCFFMVSETLLSVCIILSFISYVRLQFSSMGGSTSGKSCSLLFRSGVHGWTPYRDWSFNHNTAAFTITGMYISHGYVYKPRWFTLCCTASMVLPPAWAVGGVYISYTSYIRTSVQMTLARNRGMCEDTDKNKYVLVLQVTTWFVVSPSIYCYLLWLTGFSRQSNPATCLTSHKYYTY